MNEAAPYLLSVIVPAYNEEALLADTVHGLKAALTGLEVAAEIIIVNDGSTDRTPAIADALVATDPSIQVRHQQNQGLGGALRTGFACARGAYVLTWPADMPVEGSDLQPFIAGLGRSDVLVGVRTGRAGYNALMRFNSWLYPKIVRLLFGLQLRDVNWIHIYKTALIRRIAFSQSGIPMLVEALVGLRDMGATFLEIPTAMKPRTAGRASAARVVVMWRTIRGLIQFWWHWRRRLK